MRKKRSLHWRAAKVNAKRNSTNSSKKEKKTKVFKRFAKRTSAQIVNSASRNAKTNALKSIINSVKKANGLRVTKKYARKRCVRVALSVQKNHHPHQHPQRLAKLIVQKNITISSIRERVLKGGKNCVANICAVAARFAQMRT
jgi:septal ring factor EnvC (AmiA/AmiB activator)